MNSQTQNDNEIIISAVLCTDRAGAIGLNGAMPWTIEESKAIGELQRFKGYTLNKICICGRKTWDSIPKRYLPDRQLIVITNNIEKCEKEKNELEIEEPERILFEASLEDAILKAKEFISKNTNYANEICVIGGGSIYNELIEKNLSDILRISVLNKFYSADTFFPLKEIFFNKQYEVLSCQSICQSINEESCENKSGRLLYNIWTFKNMK